MSINRVMLSGNITRDPEVRMTASSTPVLSFGLAVNDRRRNSETGEWGGLSELHRLHHVRHPSREYLQDMAKGNKIAVDGKLRFSQWEKEGQRRTKLEVIVEDIELMYHRKDQ